jgi:phosphatidylglycerophosphate synthase
MTASPTRPADAPAAAPRETFRATLRRLASAQKPPASGSPAYSRFVNRRIGRVLAAGAFQLGLTPNQVTGISAVFSAASIAAVALLPPTPVLGALVALGLLVGYAFDSADGQLARLRGGGSPAGEWLDHVVDSVKTAALHLAVLVGWYRFTDLDPVWLLLPVAYTLVDTVFFFVTILTDQLRRAHPRQAPKPADASFASVVRSLLVAPTDFGLLCVLFALLGWPQVFGVAYGAMLVGTALFLVAALPKWFREVSRFGKG